MTEIRIPTPLGDDWVIPLPQLTWRKFQDGEWWVAECDEISATTQAKTPEDLDYAIEYLMVGRIAIAAELQFRRLNREL